MKHPKYRDQLILQLYGELSPGEGEALERHLKLCPDCRLEQEKLQFLGQVVDRGEPAFPEEHLLSARRSLRRRLHPPWGAKSPSGRRSRTASFLESYLRPANLSSAVAMLVAGLGLGYLLFNPMSDVAPGLPLEILNEEGVRISDVRFAESSSNSEEVELSFHVSRQMQIAGDLEDPAIQRLLAHALINETNAGVRLRAVSAIQSQQQESSFPRQTQIALISALRTDKNPAVRREALNALLSMPDTPMLREALLDALANDENARVRIEAINALQSLYSEGTPPEPGIAEALRQRIELDENDYVKRRAKAFLRQVNSTL